MKLIRVLVLLIVWASLFILALPASADQPGTNEDPFGGLSTAMAQRRTGSASLENLVSRRLGIHCPAENPVA